MILRRRILRMLGVAIIVGLLVFLGGSPLGGQWRVRAVDWMVPIFSAVRSGGERLLGIIGARWGRKIRELEAERTRLLAELARREELVRENEVLRTALTLRQEGEEGVMATTVVGVFREGRDEFLLLDRGTADGIGVGDLVVSRNRVLGGTVVDVGANSARAILLSSSSRSTDVIFAGRDLRAIARGNNSRELIIELVPQEAEVAVGDLLVASPRSTGGRRSILVGQVRAVRPAEHEVFKAVRAVHLFDPAEDDVLVLLAP